MIAGRDRHMTMLVVALAGLIIGGTGATIAAVAIFMGGS